MPPDATHEPGRMQGFVVSLLQHAGALVDAIEPDGLEILAPPFSIAAEGETSDAGSTRGFSLSLLITVPVNKRA